jgi:integrase
MLLRMWTWNRHMYVDSLALTAFHGLRSHEIRGLHLADLNGTRLHIGGRTILLAAPVRERLTAWLDYRGRRWPTTLNPHLFINTYTAVRTSQVNHRYLTKAIGIAIQKIREDRILNEAHATGGDTRRLCDLFGLSSKAAERYTSALGHPGLTSADVAS